MKTRFVIRWMLPAVLCIFSLNINAQETSSNETIVQQSPTYELPQAPWWVSRFKVSAGLFFVVNNTNVAINGTAGRIGTDIDLESDLGFKKNTVNFLGDFQWRISRRSRLDLSWVSLRRTSDHTIQREITFGDNTYNINSHVDAYFNTDIYRISYGYAFLSQPKYEAGVLIGAHLVGLGTGISLAGANINTQAERFSITAPLPDVGLWGGYAFSPRWAIQGEISWLQLTIDDIKGRIWSGTLQVSYHIIAGLDASLGYTGLNFKVDATRPHFNGNLKWGYNGPSLGASYSFGRKRWR
ncbi:hypothetical protein ACE38W_02120 [Chitinophaga sp. Hz27]|uniref:hypothetical protein n=1 Tax=Chitinophaga sp. Hz27 TaxID=3347169 RepID=UPI0035D55ED5